MADEARRSRTRRTVLKTGATLGTVALAGCTESTSDASTNSDDQSAGTGSDADTATVTDAESTAETGTESGDDTATPSSYSVSMVPTGEVTFESVPETWVANNGSWADMGIALGQEPPKGVWLTGRYHTQYYDEIPGVSVDKSEMVSLYQDGVSKERFYALDADVHVIDPNFLMNRFSGWDQSDIDEIDEEVAPLFGNSIYASHYPWHEDYRYYSLMEGFEKLAAVFQEQERYEAFEAVHENFQANLAPVVPAREKRPAAAVVWGGGDEPETFYPYIIGGGTGFKHLRDLGVKDALAETDIKDFHGSRGAIDFETLLEVDPPVLLLRGQEAKSREQFQNTVVSFMEEHDTASQLTAVQNGDVYRAGPLYQGPITNLVVTQRLATTLYDTDAQLYDPQRVGDIVTGEF